jgi:hypothetical protein
VVGRVITRVPDQPQTQPQQLSLPGAEELFRAVGLETLPLGVSEMTPKQLRFCVAYLSCGNARQAARESGYNEDNAAKLLQKTAISRFLGAAIKPVAENGDALVRRKWELSASLHTELMAIRGKAPAQRTEKDNRREAALMLAVTRNDTLLAALLNKLGIKLTGEINQNVSVTGGDAIVIPPESLSGFAQMRQEVAAVNRLQGGKN